MPGINLKSQLEAFPQIWRFFERVRELGGRALIVGGAVRDALSGDERLIDFDVEVYKIVPAKIEKLLRELSIRYNVAGRSFGVFKIHDFPFDIAIPRRESKCGTGHKAFVVEGDPDMTIAEAAARRDFTVNAIYYDPLTEEVIDPYGGIGDLRSRTLRHTSPAFVEDPLRVLRAMQFIARFDLKIAPETLELCKTITIENLSRERIFEEWSKLLVKGKKISAGLTFLRDCGWVRYFPELAALIGCEQDPYWHPEGDVWNHTLQCLDVFAQNRAAGTPSEFDFQAENEAVGFAVLCHDFGKPATTFRGKDGRIHSYGHEVRGEEPTRNFLGRMTQETRLVEDVVRLVKAHMRPRAIFLAGASDGAVRRLAQAVLRVDRLLRVCQADACGSNFHNSQDFKETEAWLNAAVARLGVKDCAPKPILRGRDLIANGIKPGPQMKEILDQCFEAQLDGKFFSHEDGIVFLKKLLETK
ncbi:MAG: HD domain-containing protein [Opitutales bacterium]|nr:HD domain-containing protein [Opitutales bacterium]